MKNLQVGDKVIRMLAGSIPMPLAVTEVKEDRYVCAMWEFDKTTGAEIDEDLRWGPPPLSTGSYIVPEEKQ